MAKTVAYNKEARRAFKRYTLEETIEMSEQLLTQKENNIAEAQELRNAINNAKAFSGNKKEEFSVITELEKAYKALEESDDGRINYMNVEGMINAEMDYENRQIKIIMPAGKDILAHADNLPKYFAEVVDQIVLDKNKQNSNIGGGSGGGGGGAISVPGKTSGNVNEDSKENLAPTEENSYKFDDLESSIWAGKYIMRLAEKNIVSMPEDRRFNPDRSVTREEFLKMLMLAINITNPINKEVTFQDCDVNAWYYPYIKLAYGMEIVNGVDKYCFGIGEKITRQDMAVMLYNALETKNVVLPKAEIEFNSSENFADYALAKVYSIIEVKIMQGYDDGLFRPTELSTRAEAATVICRMLDYLEGEI